MCVKSATQRWVGAVASNCRGYAPSVFREYVEAISGSDLVTCIDILEHIEPELLENVLLELKRLHGRLYFFTIHLGPAGKTLSDGRNAHLIQNRCPGGLLAFANTLI